MKVKHRRHQAPWRRGSETPDGLYPLVFGPLILSLSGPLYVAQEDLMLRRYEQRLLEEIERNLHAEDPRLARKLTDVGLLVRVLA